MFLPNINFFSRTVDTGGGGGGGHAFEPPSYGMSDVNPHLT